MFRVGQKVECISAAEDAGKKWRDEHRPIVGAIYTVASVPFISTRTGNTCVTIAELPAPPSGGHRISRFRPIVERKTDISIFTAMLTPTRKTARIPARAS